MILLTQDQESALKKAVKWYKGCRDLVFTILGCAGSGKSTLIKYICEYLRLNIDTQVKFVCFTGKAAQILNKKGLPAVTIHRLIYLPVEYSVIENGRMVIKIKFELRKSLEDTNIQLLVLDEGSMVSDALLADILSFKIRLIILGDEAQLPPVEGDTNKFFKNPDMRLTQIVRQALDNPIIYYATQVREGKSLSLCNIEKKFAVITKSNITDRMLTKADQIICGKNTTRNSLNLYMREILHYKEEYPMQGEKLVCKRNNWNLAIDWKGQALPLINGTIGFIKEDARVIKQAVMLDEDKVSMISNYFIDFKPDFVEEDNYFNNIRIDKDSLESGLVTAKSSDKELNYFNWGYAISCHVSQSAEYNKVVVFEECFGDAEFHKRWLYTAITRAKEKIIIVKE